MKHPDVIWCEDMQATVFEERLWYLFEGTAMAYNAKAMKDELITLFYKQDEKILPKGTEQKSK